MSPLCKVDNSCHLVYNSREKTFNRIELAILTSVILRSLISHRRNRIWKTTSVTNIIEYCRRLPSLSPVATSIIVFENHTNAREKATSLNPMKVIKPIPDLKPFEVNLRN
jgi:hypothetical protein